MAEIISKKVGEDQIFAYTAMRLRQIGQELDAVDKQQNEALAKQS